VEHGPEDQLGVSDEHRLEQVRRWRDSKPALISLTGNPHPTLMDGLDPARLATSAPVDLISETMPLVSTNTLAWTVVGAPTPGWAASVGVADLAALWDGVATAMRLDEADPVAAFRYRGPGTDVTIGLSSRARWEGGSATTSGGVDFVPNMPTEEVFISPDWRRADGTVRTSAPFFLMTMGTLVEDLSLEIKDGTIVGANAARGEEEVRQQFDLIPRSRHLGEVAIVDQDSAVARTGLVYKDMLFDENVGSHIAWGMGFATSYGMLDATPEECIEAGLNQANTHVDIVIGSPEVQIDGLHADGSTAPITRGDEFVLKD
jgi:aminopeptidase